MTRPGYAIEYDYYPPTQLRPWLETKAVEQLFFAGEINGTTGYEEAGGQGVVARTNAVRRRRGQEPVLLGRDAAYIGVLVDDLVTRGVDEPYRLFTSRSEFRLLLRQDNALRRLAPLADRLGLLNAAELRTAERRRAAEDGVLAAARAATLAPAAAAPVLLPTGTTLPEPERVATVARRPGAALGALLAAAGLPPPAVVHAVPSAGVRLTFDDDRAREPDLAAPRAGTDALLRQRLIISGDLAADKTAGPFDDSVAEAVKRFQIRHGLASTGTVTPRTLAALNVSVQKRVKQLEASLQRLENINFSFGQRYVVVNLPATFAEAVENDVVVRRYRVIVGKTEKPSPTLTADITGVVLNPTWTVPSSIAKTEISAHMRKDPSYLSRMHMEVLDGHD